MINQALKNLSTRVVKPDVEWNNEYIPKIQSTVKPDKDHSFNEISNNLYKQIRPKQMKQSNSAHLKGITVDGFNDWLNDDLFTTYASSTSTISGGVAYLGVDGTGSCAVRHRHKTGADTTYYNDVNKAIEAYGNLLD